MTYLSVRQKRYGKYTRIAVLIVCTILITVFWSKVKETLYPAFVPVAKGYAGARDGMLGIPDTVSVYLSTHREDEAKIRSLTLEVERLQNEIARLGRQEVEEEVAATGTERLLRVQGSLVMYPVIKDVTRVYSTVVLSKGFVDEVREGALVYIQGYQGVGSIEQVFKDTSVMKLFSAPGNLTQAIVKETGVTVTLEGQGGGSFTIDVPKTVTLAENQTVYLAEDQAMLIGTISSVRNDPQDTFVRAYVRSPYSPTKANTFYVTQ